MSRRFYSASSQYLEVASALTTTMPLTFACWYNFITNQTQSMITIADSSNANRRFTLCFAGNSTSAIHHDGTTAATATRASNFQNKWIHAAAVFTSATSRQAFANGIGGNVVATNVANSMAGCDTTSIGRRNSSTPAEFFDGIIAHAAIWSVDLSAGQIKALANGALPDTIQPNSLLGYWPLNGVSSIQELNRSPQLQQSPMVLTGPPVFRQFNPDYLLQNMTRRRRNIFQAAAAGAVGAPYYYRHLAGVG